MYSKPVSLLLTNCQFPAIGLSHVSLSHKIKCTDKQKYAYASGLKLDLANLHIQGRSQHSQKGGSKFSQTLEQHRWDPPPGEKIS